MLLSVVVPAHNEEGIIGQTLLGLQEALDSNAIPHELLVVDDVSTDGTPETLASLSERIPTLRVVRRSPPCGVGRAIRDGLAAARGDAIAIVMADASDDPLDLCRYYDLLQQGYDCVFGSRFLAGSRVLRYPRVKLLLNRLGNTAIGWCFGRPENDLSNAFKAYRASVIQTIGPPRSENFEVFIELPLRAVRSGASVATTPISWYGRRAGTSKLRLLRSLPLYLTAIGRLWLEPALAPVRRAGKRPRATRSSADVVTATAERRS